jgi:protein gp37
VEAGWTGDVRMVPEHLADPLKWRRPRRIFVNSMSDLFHERLSNEQIAAVFGVMAACPQHTFQVLTKRAGRMREWFAWLESQVDKEGSRAMHCGSAQAVWCWVETNEILREHDVPSVVNTTWPLRNLWLGVSVENQDAADERIPDLLATPATVRFLSCEPLLGPVELSRTPRARDGDPVPRQGIDWVIAGCESGPGARPCDVAWLRSLRDQCSAAGVSYFLKQAVGETARCDNPPPDDCGQIVRYQVVSERTAIASCGCTIEGGEACDPPPIAEGDGSKRKPGGVIELPYLDGVQHAAFPERP